MTVRGPESRVAVTTPSDIGTGGGKVDVRRAIRPARSPPSRNSDLDQLTLRSPFAHTRQDPWATLHAFAGYESAPCCCWRSWSLLAGGSGRQTLGGDRSLRRCDVHQFHSEGGSAALPCFLHSGDKAGNLWFGSVRGGVYRYDGRVFKLFTVTDGLASNLVISVVDDWAGNIWFGTDRGVSRYDGKSLTRLTTRPASAFFEDKSGNLWLSESDVARSGMILSRYDGKSFTEVTTSGQIFGIAEDRDGNIWFGTVNGVSRYDGKRFTSFADELKWGVPRNR